MRRTALLAAVVGGLLASSSFGALQVFLNGVNMSPTNSTTATPGTSTGGVPAGSQVYLITIKDNSNATTAINAASLTATASGAGAFYFPGGDSAGGVSNATTTAAINKRSNPDGTFFFIPGATATVATNLDNPLGSFPETDNGEVKNFSIQTFRGDLNPYTTTAANGLVLGAIVVAPGTQFTLVGTVNPTLDSPTAVAFSYNIPEPTTLAAVGMAAMGLVRRRK